MNGINSYTNNIKEFKSSGVKNNKQKNIIDEQSKLIERLKEENKQMKKLKEENKQIEKLKEKIEKQNKYIEKLKLTNKYKFNKMIKNRFCWWTQAIIKFNVYVASKFLNKIPCCKNLTKDRLCCKPKNKKKYKPHTNCCNKLSIEST